MSLLLLAATNGHAIEKLVIKGSDTLGAKLIPQLAEEFRARHPDIIFEIQAEGSTTGISAIIDGTADIATSSRKASIRERTAARAKGVTLNEIVVAYDGIAVVVNESNVLDNIRYRDLERIFTGDVVDWSAIAPMSGPISLYTRNTASGTYQDFKKLAMRRRDYAHKSQKMAGNEQIVQEVGKNINGIGYVGLSYLKSEGIKALPVDHVLPNAETIVNQSYSLTRPNYFYTNGSTSGITKAFIEFVLSEKGQTIIERVGFVTIPQDALNL